MADNEFTYGCKKQTRGQDFYCVKDKDATKMEEPCLRRDDGNGCFNPKSKTAVSAASRNAGQSVAEAPIANELTADTGFQWVQSIAKLTPVAETRTGTASVSPASLAARLEEIARKEEEEIAALEQQEAQREMEKEETYALREKAKAERDAKIAKLEEANQLCETEEARLKERLEGLTAVKTSSLAKLSALDEHKVRLRNNADKRNFLKKSQEEREKLLLEGLESERSEHEKTMMAEVQLEQKLIQCNAQLETLKAAIALEERAIADAKELLSRELEQKE
jgi:hypothetical protein